MLDRLAVLVPDWRERNPADLGVALVELLAYVGDHLSYQQDAVATEAYLGTARRRVSVRRHARLVDYAMHDGCNARAWVHIGVENDAVGSPLIPAKTKLCTGLPGQLPAIDDPALLAKADAVFETMADVSALFAEHCCMPFYTWGDDACCLPVGSTRATLKGHFPGLDGGDPNADPPVLGEVLIFEEVLGPRTGLEADVDPEHRWAVRLTKVGLGMDLVMGEKITEIEWDEADALQFPLCVSSRADKDHGGGLIEKVSVAHGNIVLVDHGMWLYPEKIGCVPKPRIYLPEAGDACQRRDPEPVPPRFRPTLAQGPLTQVEPFAAGTPASRALISDPAAAVPAICLDSDLKGDKNEWDPALDLLDFDDDVRVFVAEVEEDRTTTLRFGNDTHGQRPEQETEFTATYRIGNGRAGNVGQDAIVHIDVSGLTGVSILEVRNPLPARGGVDPESMEDVRQRAPYVFRTQKRAVTEADYADRAQSHSGIQRAAATFRWTGSWHTVFLTLDRIAARPIDEEFERAVIATSSPSAWRATT